ncbi:MAG: hypothetical protein OXI01_15780 [Albidovulum sp.]|nr:hypothetical protein [Albidovulum sp.]
MLPPELPAIRPNITEIYLREVERFSEVPPKPEERNGTASEIHGLISRINSTPGATRGEVRITPHGDLGSILQRAGKSP